MKSLGIVEYRSIALGLQAADSMVKAADIKLLISQVVCPGKYIILFTGKLSSVKAALEVAAKPPLDTVLIDTYLLGNPDESLIPALYGACEKGNPEAVGIIEGYSVASIVGIADEIVKTSPTKLIEIRMARGMTGKAFALFSGELAAVQASMEKAKGALLENGMYLHSAVIPHPDPQIWEAL
ncbi:propanediol utilization protein [Sporanaerobium hydrogeniformans]|uniref:Propanediol utilization protein n=2 Tax=Sporanaerobium hydrogeniformans TaxID=3072179 RepID=A0AC61DJ13_9FIRM|nr:propanediol utilization protein [Sporanaerobium hydrogeniformans]